MEAGLGECLEEEEGRGAGQGRLTGHILGSHLTP